MNLLGINHMTLSCNDLERSFYFYKELLGFKPVMKWKRRAYFLVGDFWFCLSLNKVLTDLAHTDYRHTAFSIASTDFENLKHHLISNGVKQWSDNTSEGNSFYFLDPDGHHLEIHVGDLRSRLDSIRNKPWEGGVEFF